MSGMSSMPGAAPHDGPSLIAALFGGNAPVQQQAAPAAPGAITQTPATPIPQPADDDKQRKTTVAAALPNSILGNSGTADSLGGA